jgi:two-component system phosphate regulon sensor histidine kinase PhoR
VWRRDVREELVKGADQFVPHLGMTVGEAVQQWGYRSVLAVPIISRDTALGAVCIYWDDPHEPDDRELRVLSALARQAAVAMENARHYAETRTQQTRLAQILESTSDGILVVGRDGRIEAANNRAGRMLRFDHAGSIGLPIIEVLERYRGNVANFEQTAVALAALTADPDQEMAGDMDIRSLKRVVHWTARPTRDGAGATVAFTLTFQDVTQEREVSQMKSDFVSFVTHQLRTPLAGIRWMLELAAQEPGMPAEATSFVQDARDSAQRLITLVNDLLDISRLERGRMTMAPEPVNLGELTRGVLDEMAPLITEKGHKLTVRGVRAAPRALADPQLLRQVVLNLVSNAVKYTPTGGRIALRIERRAEGVQWSIRDSGIGIPAAALPRMFEKFYRAENVHAVETEGTGLGLYLVRLILEQSGGRVWCESREGQGSTFTFTLPRAEGDA